MFAKIVVALLGLAVFANFAYQLLVAKPADPRLFPIQPADSPESESGSSVADDHDPRT